VRYGVALSHPDLGNDPGFLKDFAQAVGISASNAGVRVFRAREALKVQVKRCCGSCADDNCRDCTCHTEAPA
jgi:RNA polymerase sigma-70 factor (ECF subfamily)